ncbi:MAG TPA: hypothetical protein VGS07_21245 [Thermoanaerobaculia bacterium]|jgi:hypothetical protein|nr:hypothetical protein [Thermoanaerobaculia bacterium]
MEPNITAARTRIEPIGARAEAIAGTRVIRQMYSPPYANPPISNYRKFWYSNPSASWAAFRVFPGDGSIVNQLGSNPVTRPETAFQEAGFGYTFKSAATTDYWFDVAFQAGPITSKGSKTSIELELFGSGLPPVVCVLTGPLNATLTFNAYLEAGSQYTLLVKTKVEISMTPGGKEKYGEVIARFPSLTVSYALDWRGIEPVQGEGLQIESLDLAQALKALKAGKDSAEVLLQPVSYKDIAQAGAAGFGGFSDAK